MLLFAGLKWFTVSLDNFSDTFRNLEDNLMFFILKKCKSEEIHYILFIM